MISNLKAKLRTISSSSPSSRDCGLPQESADRGDLGGSIVKGAKGEYMVKTSNYRFNYSYGAVLLEGLKSMDLSASSWWTRLGDKIDVHDLVFLDTETTGLAGGTGTMAFLVGLGFIGDRGFTVRQYLARDFDEEHSMLETVINTLKDFKVLVTFNGKSFDWPLLESRLIYSRLGPIQWEGRHLDLLHVSRRLWGKKLNSCSLTSIEENILGHFRTDDIPGMMIPGVYMHYLETRMAGDMLRVIGHNQMDIAAMAALLIKITALYSDPKMRCDSWELFGIARDLERSLRIEEACESYRICADMARDNDLSVQAKKRMAYLLKRHKGPEAAVDLWIDIAGSGHKSLIFPLIEMAKFLEHKRKDYNQALVYTEKALAILGKGCGHARKSLEFDLKKRKARLKKKKSKAG